MIPCLIYQAPVGVRALDRALLGVPWGTAGMLSWGLALYQFNHIYSGSQKEGGMQARREWPPLYYHCFYYSSFSAYLAVWVSSLAMSYLCLKMEGMIRKWSVWSLCAGVEGRGI